MLYSQKQHVSLLYKLFSPPHPVLLRSNALVIGFPNRGDPGDPVWADMGTLLIVHFKVLVFPHQWGIFVQQSPQYVRGKPDNQQDLMLQFILVLEQLSNA